MNFLNDNDVKIYNGNVVIVQGYYVHGKLCIIKFDMLRIENGVIIDENGKEIIP